MSTKSVLVVVLVAVLLGIVVCGGAGAYWYFKMAQPADVGPLPGAALSLPADTAVAGGFDAKGFFGSAAWKQISTGEIAGMEKTLSPAELESTKKQIREGVEKGLAEGEAKTGIRFDKDVDRLVLAVWNVNATPPEIAVVAVGRFDAAKIAKAVEASAKSEGGQFQTKTVAGTNVMVVGEAGKPAGGVAVIDAARLVAGTQAGVEAFVTNAAAPQKPRETNASLIALVKAVDATSSYWLVADTPVFARAEKETGGAAPVPIPKSMSLFGKLEGGLTLSAQMADEAAAKAVAAQIEGGLGMVKMQAAENPEVQKVPGAKEALDSITVKAEGPKVTLEIKPTGGGGLAGMVAAVAVPSLLKARVSANEAAAIGDIRTIISAQAAYESVGGGYGDLACLGDPKACVADYTGPQFIDASLAGATEKGGYKRAFFTGPAMGEKRYSTFAYTAVPVTPGQTGVRSFCGDQSGNVCADPTGAPIAVTGGVCPSSCGPLDAAMSYAPQSPPPFDEAPQADVAPPPTAPPAAPKARPAPRATPRATPRPAATPEATLPPEPTRPSGPVRVGGDIKEPTKLKNVNPVYPEMAKRARSQGVVILECTINEQGKVTDVKVLRGVPMLDQAAMDAVKQWVYTPTLLNGIPVPVVMTVTVNFRLQ
jgi:protein TonB